LRNRTNREVEVELELAVTGVHFVEALPVRSCCAASNAGDLDLRRFDLPRGSLRFANGKTGIRRASVVGGRIEGCPGNKPEQARKIVFDVSDRDS